jgi:hypothetical protein
MPGSGPNKRIYIQSADHHEGWCAFVSAECGGCCDKRVFGTEERPREKSEKIWRWVDISNLGEGFDIKSYGKWKRNLVVKKRRRL